MADIEITGEQVVGQNEENVDVEMVGDDVVEVEAVANPDGDQNGDPDDGLPFQNEEEEAKPARVTYVNYLRSPIIELNIGQGDEQTALTAHQALLVQSPFFAEACAQFGPSTSNRSIDLPDENLDAVGCFLEYLYTGEYFPQKVAGQRGLVKDPTLPDLDQTGDQLLKHARVYTLADKLGMDKLKTLAHSKIHCVNSSAKGELAYARYVYATTPKEDDTIRKPVASFWAHRSHVLRSEAEDEFRLMCLEFPQFSFDVITRLLDEKAKNERAEKPHAGTPATGSRKRPRQSQI